MTQPLWDTLLLSPLGTAQSSCVSDLSYWPEHLEESEVSSHPAKIHGRARHPKIGWGTNNHMLMPREVPEDGQTEDSGWQEGHRSFQCTEAQTAPLTATGPQEDVFQMASVSCLCFP